MVSIPCQANPSCPSTCGQTGDMLGVWCQLNQVCLSCGVQELNELVAKSERWRGPRGERRKIIVHKFVPDIKSDDEAGAADKKGKKRRDSKGSRKGSTGSTGSIGDGAEVDVKKLSASIV